MTARVVDVTIYGPKGRNVVKGIDVGPFAVTQCVGVENQTKRRYTITHTASGKALATSDDVFDSVEFIEKITPLCDWSKKAPTFETPDLRAQAKHLLEAFMAGKNWR